MIITIDGSAGSGKSTVARKLAAHLEIPYLDTGAMYRALAHTVLRTETDPRDEQAVAALARGFELEIDCGPTHTRVRVDGHDVSEAIRSLEVSRLTSDVARNASVRETMVAQQRRIGKKLGSFVSEGRDQGAVVFPDADAKFILEASLERRARRRFRELQVDGEECKIQDVLDNLSMRDESDSRQWEPLLASGEAIVLDTTNMTIQQVIARMVEHISQA